MLRFPDEISWVLWSRWIVNYNHIMKKPTTTIKIEVYEDSEEDFLALMYLLKSTLTEDGIDSIMNNYKDSSDFTTQEKDQIITSQAKQEKEYLSFIKKLANCVHIESIYEPNDEDEDLTEYPFGDEYSKYAIGEYHGHPLYERVKTFINNGTLVPSSLEGNRIEELYEYIINTIEGTQPSIKKTDQFMNAASNFNINSIELPGSLYRIFTYPYSFGRNFRLSPNESFDKITYKDKYHLCGSIYWNLKSSFPELYFKEKEKGKDYQLRLLTGFIVSFHDGFLMNEEQYYDKGEDGSSKSFREYLADTVSNYINKAPSAFTEEE